MMKSTKEEHQCNSYLTVPQGTSCKVDGSEEPMQTVHEVCKELGITRKTLFYYDKIGLLKASSRKGKQHGKLYSKNAVNRLKMILSYQDAGLTLKEIDEVLNQPDTNTFEVFIQARNRLIDNRNRADEQIQKLDALIQNVLVKGEKDL